MQQLEELARRTGRLPQALENEPEILPDMVRYWEGFLVLHRGRQAGFGVSPIAVGDAIAYAEVAGIRRVRYFVRVVQELDRIWLEWYARQRENESRARMRKAAYDGAWTHQGHRGR